MSTYDGYIDVALDLLRDMDTPKSLAISLVIKHREWSQLADLQADPAHYLTADRYVIDAAASALLMKCKNLPGLSAKALRTAAVSKWSEAEKLCCLTNTRFRNYRSGYYPDVAPRIVEYLHDVKNLIARVLGRIPKDLPRARFGKGATYHDKSRICTVLHKMQNQPTLTSQVTDLLPLLEETAWFRALTSRPISSPLSVRGNRFTTVPKNAKGDRAIAVEPSINIWFQLGVGSYIRDRLKQMAMIDLDDGQDQHRALAQLGSRNGSLATIDLSSASDTVSLELVRFLLPDDWASLLETLRSPTTKIGNQTYHLEKFSSMGNGFTFELETLIFWSICQTLVRGVVYCYGDDIIVPTEKSEDVLGALRFFGFKPNTEKTYTHSAFRESCGGDFFLGQDVRPYYLKEPPNEPQQWISFANGLRRLSLCLNGTGGCLDPRVRRAYLRCLGNIPGDIRRIKGPEWLGDLCLHDDDPDHWVTRIPRTRGKPVYGRENPGLWGVTHVQVYRPIAGFTGFARFDPDVQLAAALYGVPSRGALSRSSVKGYKKAWVPLVPNCPEVKELLEILRDQYN